MSRETLSDVIDDYLAQRARQYSANTVKNDDRCMRKFLAVVGNIQTKSIQARHVDRFFAERARTCGPGTLNTDLSSIKAFFKWCRARRLYPANEDPTVGQRWLKVPPKKNLMIPAHDFPRVLDCAEHPIDRIVVSVGLYLFTRQSETQSLTVSDVDLDRGEISVTVHKTTQRDDMPICEELDDELRRWLRVYPTLVRQGWSVDWFLCPSKMPPPYNQHLRAFSYQHAEDPYVIRPDRKISRVYDVINRVLVKAGYPAETGSGEGGHTLRRSGARALYEQLSEQGHDGAVRRVQAMLHHASMETTEHYLDIRLDQVERNRLIRGKRMFPKPDHNVVELRPVGDV